MPPIRDRLKLRRRALPPPADLDVGPFTLGPEDAPLGCLLIHGFSGSPAEMRGLGHYLAQKGARVEAVRLAGHGTEPEELKRFTWRDWLQSAEEGLERLGCGGRRVVVIGFSMGGLLAIRLCAAQPERIERLVVISSPIYFHDRRIHLIPVVRRVIPWHRVRRPSENIDPDAHTRYVAYRRYPLVAVDRLLNLMRTTRKLLPEVTTPVLVMHGTHDRVIHPRSASYIFGHLGSRDKDLIWWHNSGHGVVFDSERRAVWEKVWQFVSG